MFAVWPRSYFFMISCVFFMISCVWFHDSWFHAYFYYNFMNSIIWSIYGIPPRFFSRYRWFFMDFVYFVAGFSMVFMEFWSMVSLNLNFNEKKNEMKWKKMKKMKIFREMKNWKGFGTVFWEFQGKFWDGNHENYEFMEIQNFFSMKKWKFMRKIENVLTLYY